MMHVILCHRMSCIFMFVDGEFAIAREFLQCVLQCVAVCCSVLQYVAECCSVLQCVVVCCSVLQCVAV